MTVVDATGYPVRKVWAIPKGTDRFEISMTVPMADHACTELRVSMEVIPESEVGQSTDVLGGTYGRPA